MRLRLWGNFTIFVIISFLLSARARGLKQDEMTLHEGKEHLRQKRFGVGLFHFGGEVGMKDHLGLVGMS